MAKECGLVMYLAGNPQRHSSPSWSEFEGELEHPAQTTDVCKARSCIFYKQTLTPNSSCVASGTPPTLPEGLCLSKLKATPSTSLLLLLLGASFKSVQGTDYLQGKALRLITMQRFKIKKFQFSLGFPAVPYRCSQGEAPQTGYSVGLSVWHLDPLGNS